MAPQTGSASVLGHTSGPTTTSVPCSSWAAEAADPRELQQHYDMVVVVVEKILSRTSPKHRTHETGSASKGRKMPTKGHMRASVRVCERGVSTSSIYRRGEGQPKGHVPAP